MRRPAICYVSINCINSHDSYELIADRGPFSWVQLVRVGARCEPASVIPIAACKLPSFSLQTSNHGAACVAIQIECADLPFSQPLSSQPMWHFPSHIAHMLCVHVAEPGAGSSYFDFDNRSEANAVIGHDNTFHGASSQVRKPK